MDLRSRLASVANKLNNNRRHKGENNFAIIDDFSGSVETQQKLIKNVDRNWKKYQQKVKDFAEASKHLDESVNAFCGLENDISETTSEDSLLLPRQGIEEMLMKLDKFSTELKKAKKQRSDYLSHKQSYESESDYLRKENAKIRLDNSEAKLKITTEALQKSLPDEIKKNEAKMLEISMQYYKAKQEKMIAIAKHMEHILERLRDKEPSYQPGGPHEYASFPNGSPINQTAYSAGEYANTLEWTPNATVNPPTYPASSNGNNESDLATKPKPFNVVATNAYSSDEKDELQFEAGDQITVQEWPDPDDEEPGWLYGIHKKTGREGLFPANHVKLC